MIGAVAINCGALSGANFMTSGSGIIFRGLMDEDGYGDLSFNYSAVIFIASVIFSLLLITLFRLISKNGPSGSSDASFEKPKPFTPLQKKNVYLMLLMIVVVLLFPILHIILPDAEIISFINSKMDVGLIAIIFSGIALFMKLGNQKEVLAKVPWNTIVMICGVGMLINVAIVAGTIDLLADWAGSSLPTWLIPLAFSIVGAIMSFFSSTLGVVCPALFPLVPALVETTGIHPLVLFSCIVIGAQSSAISPFSSGGSLIMGSCTTEEDRNEMFPKLLFKAVPISVLSSLLFNLILSFIL